MRSKTKNCTLLVYSCAVIIQNTKISNFLSYQLPIGFLRGLIPTIVI